MANLMMDSGSALTRSRSFSSLTAMASVESQASMLQDKSSLNASSSSPGSSVPSSRSGPSLGKASLSFNLSRGVSPRRYASLPDDRSPVALHSCVIRLRVEDRHLAEDVREGVETPKDRLLAAGQVASHADEIIISPPRPPTPSRLGSNSGGGPSLVWNAGMLTEVCRSVNCQENLPSASFHFSNSTATSIAQH